MFGAYRGRVLRIDLSKGKAKAEKVPAEWMLKYLGGRGFGARYYYDEISPIVSPLSSENKLFIMTGPFTGAPVFGPSKSTITTKSPLTNHYFVANASGYFGPNIKFAGYDGLIIEGKAEKPTYISLVEDNLEFRDASQIWGLKTSETQKAIREEIGERRASVACIGPSGEKLTYIACIQADARSYGRGGIGAVMGSKNLKAIAVFGSSKVKVAEPDKLRELLREEIKALRQTTRDHTRHGTPQYTEVLYELGAYPIENFTRTRVEGGVEGITGQVMREKFLVKDTACYGCPVACGKLCEVREGPWRGCRGELDYEIIWSFGPHCGVYDLNTIIAAVGLSDEFGLDAMSCGYTIGFAMELYERGVINEKDTGGTKLRFGNSDAEIDLLLKIAARQGIGNVLAQGAAKAAESFGRNASYYVMHVKGLEFAGYDPRAFHGMGLSYATSSRGACHNVGGWTIRDELIRPVIDRYAVEGKGRFVKSIQDVRGYIDSIGICTVPRRAMHLTDSPREDIVNLVTGMDFTGKLLSIGERVYNLERIILNREGISRRDDTLPTRIMTEPIPDGPAKGHVITPTMMKLMLDEYYTARGWDLNGFVTKGTLKRLDIP